MLSSVLTLCQCVSVELLTGTLRRMLTAVTTVCPVPGPAPALIMVLTLPTVPVTYHHHHTLPPPRPHNNNPHTVMETRSLYAQNALLSTLISMKSLFVGADAGFTD